MTTTTLGYNPFLSNRESGSMNGHGCGPPRSQSDVSDMSITTTGYNPFLSHTLAIDYSPAAAGGTVEETTNIYGEKIPGGGTNSLGADLSEYIVSIPTGDRTIFYYLVIVLFTLTVFLSLLVNLFFSLVLIRIKTYKRPFYRTVWQLVFANIFVALSNVFTTIPVTYFLSVEQSKIYVLSLPYIILNFFDNAGDQLIAWITLLIALHRFCIFVKPSISEKLFKGASLNILIVSIWLIGGGITLVLIVFGCSYKFKDDKNGGSEGFEFSCRVESINNYRQHIEGVLTGQAVLFPLIALVCYFLIMLEIITRRDGIKNVLPDEVTILKQAIFLFVAFKCSVLVSYISIYVTTTDTLAFLVRRIINMVELLAGIVTPILFFFTSREIRKCARQFLHDV